MNRFFRPALGLEQFVRFYALRRMSISGAPVVHPVTARAVPMIEFDFGDPINALCCKQRTLKKSPTVVVVGPQTHRRVDLHLQRVFESFVIMFQPDGLYRLFSIPMHELIDKDYEGHAVLGAFISGIRERAGECKSFEERVSLVDEFLLRRALASADYNGISAAANRILVGGGRVAIAALADRTGLSMRQFERSLSSGWVCAPSSSRGSPGLKRLLTASRGSPRGPGRMWPTNLGITTRCIWCTTSGSLPAGRRPRR
ncbi:MAG TPA: DUF6597 domain-containing transcriptional factor [Chthoniobacterales bacterium]|jgi:hypothetical protein|nr:DUF6597 domain-containing transcriptional factor [Chthoniobacterales bacterium]